MKVSKISISNFRSIEKVDNLSLNSFSVFVGQNNHGKTNFFEAIEWFYNGGDEEEIIRKGKNKDDVFVELEFVGSQEGLTRIGTLTHKTKISNIIGDNDTIRVRRKLSDVKKRYYISYEGKEIDFGLGIDNALLDFFPKLQFVKTETSLKEVTKYGRKTPMSEMLSEVLEQVLDNEAASKEYTDFKNNFNKLFGEHGAVGKGLVSIGEKVNAYVNKQFECESVSFIPNLPTFDDIFKNITTNVNDGTETTAEEKGDGMQRALMLAIIQTYADYRRQNENSKDFVFLIDEGELHLHPSAQRSLKNALLELSDSGDQILLTTHSSVLIADESPAQKLFKVEKINHITFLNEINDFEKQYVVFDLLGGNPIDLLLPSNILIVEGYSEVKFLRAIVQRFYPDFSEKIQIVPANGDITKQDKSITFLDMAYEYFRSKKNPYFDKVVVIVDGPNTANQTEYIKFKKKNPELIAGQRYFELPVGSLEEYYPSPFAASPSSIAGRIGGKNLYADEVSSKISKNDFETSMTVIMNALVKVDKLSFGK